MRCLLLLCCCLQIWAAELPIPNDYETLALEHINYLRMHPQRASHEILYGAQGGISGMKPDVDLELCQKEIAAFPAVPPLVFDQFLIKSSRAHAQYMINVGETTHDETPGEKGFTGARPFQRMQAAGYRGMALMENVYLFSVSMWNAHRGFIIDWGPGPGGMQTGRGHRVSCLSPRCREAGIGVIPHRKDTHLSIVHNFGSKPQHARYVGGVFYADKNKNARYDIGEGVADVEITADSGEQTKTWPSGAYTLVLKHREVVNITVRYNKAERIYAYPAGAKNLRCAGVVPNKEEQEQVTLLVKKFKESEQSFTDSINLYLASQLLAQRSEDAAFILEETATAEERWWQDRKNLIQAYSSGSSRTFKPVLSKMKTAYKGSSAYQWFKQAESSFEEYVDAKKVIDNIRKRVPMRKNTITKQIKASQRLLKRLVKYTEIHDIIQAQYLVLSRTVQTR